MPSEALARAAAASDLVIVEGIAVCPSRILAPIGSHVLAAVARSLGVPVWCTLGIGRRLPVEYVDEIADRVFAGADPWDLDLDDVPVQLVTHVATVDGVTADVAAGLRAECASGARVAPRQPDLGPAAVTCPGARAGSR